MARTRRSTATGAARRSESSGGSRARPFQEHEHGEMRDEHAADSPHAASSGAHVRSEPGASAEVEHLQEMASDMAPQLGAAAVAAIATAVVMPEFLPAVLIGAGATLAPRLLPGASYVFRPIMKTMLRAGYAAASTVQHLAAEAGEQMQDVIAEVQAEQRARAPHRARARAGTRQGADSTATAPH